MSLKHSKNFNFEKNLDKNSNVWKQQYDFYLLAASVTKK